MASVAETILANADPVHPDGGSFKGLSIREHIAVQCFLARRTNDDVGAAAAMATAAVADADALLAELRPAP